MPLDIEHLEEICADIKSQYENGVCDLALFMIKLVPEGNPCIDKARIACEKYDVFRDRLAQMGLDCGILVQCTIGHGYALNQMFPFVQYQGLKDGKKANIVCPYDQGFREFMYNQFQTLAKHNPKVIMLDDDFRLIARSGRGCACELHRDKFNAITGENITAPEQLDQLLSTKSDKQNEYGLAFLKTQEESLLGCVKYMRDGIDSINPNILGVYCCCGSCAESAGEIAQIFAGKNNPAILRLNNGFYCRESAKYISYSSYAAAQQKYFVKDKVNYFLAETDTCPQNRYSTPAAVMHSHYVLSILEGITGTKHWITRLVEYEEESGRAYRKILSKHKKMYDKLMEIYPQIEWQGCKIPLIKNRENALLKTPAIYNSWGFKVLERLGLPTYFSADNGGLAFVDEDLAFALSDNEILEILKGASVLSIEAVEHFIERGFGEYLGVKVAEWKGLNRTRERILNPNKICSLQVNSKQLILASNKTQTLSQVEHLKNGVESIPLYPAVTMFENTLGGVVVCFSGTPNTNFTYTQAFSFLNQSRKAQFVSILEKTKNLCAYYKGDADVFVKSGKLKGGGQIIVLTNISYDQIDDIELGGIVDITSIKMLTPNGEFVDCEFNVENSTLLLNTTLYPMQPMVLIIK